MDQMKRAVSTEVVKALDSGEFEVPGSTESIDSHGEVITVRGWDLTRYTGRKNGGVPTKAGNPVILFGHNYGAPPIGKATKVTKDLGARPALVIRYKLMEAGDYGDDWPANLPSPVAVASMLRAGYLKGHSVGFSPIESEPMDPEAQGWHQPQRWLKQSLNEFSVVSLPSNADALHNSMSRGFLTRSHLPGVYAQVVRSEVPDLDEVQAALEEEMSAPRRWFVPQDLPPAAPRRLADLTEQDLRAIVREELYGAPEPGDGEESEEAPDTKSEQPPQQREAAPEISEAQAILIYQRLLDIEPLKF